MRRTVQASTFARSGRVSDDAEKFTHRAWRVFHARLSGRRDDDEAASVVASRASRYVLFFLLLLLLRAPGETAAHRNNRISCHSTHFLPSSALCLMRRMKRKKKSVHDKERPLFCFDFTLLLHLI